MDCEQISELLDAYSLGAAEPDEALALEEHVADCVRCWSSLNEAQRAAATIALSTAIQRAPESLRQRILKEAGREERPLAPRLQHLIRRLWPAAAGVVAAGAAASLAFAFVLQSEVSDLRGENDDLVAEVESAGDLIAEQRQLMAVFAAPDIQNVNLEATDPTSPAFGVYHWSSSTESGALLCENMPPLEEGQAYNIWLLTPTGSHSIGSFDSWDGIGYLSLESQSAVDDAVAIGLSIDDASAQRPGEMFLYAEFGQ